MSLVEWQSPTPAKQIHKVALEDIIWLLSNAEEPEMNAPGAGRMGCWMNGRMDGWMAMVVFR